MNAPIEKPRDFIWQTKLFFWISWRAITMRPAPVFAYLPQQKSVLLGLIGIAASLEFFEDCLFVKGVSFIGVIVFLLTYVGVSYSQRAMRGMVAYSYAAIVLSVFQILLLLCVRVTGEDTLLILSSLIGGYELVVNFNCLFSAFKSIPESIEKTGS